jgi:hypothetical protein
MATIDDVAGKKDMRPLSRAIGAMHALAGWLLIYLAIGGALGFAFWQPLTDGPSCFPRITVFGVLTTSCPMQIVNIFWYFAVEVPRFAVVILAMPLMFVFVTIKAMIFAGGQKTTYYSYLWNAVPWLRATIPLLILIFAGGTFWWKRTRAIALGAPAAFVAAAVYLAILA